MKLAILTVYMVTPENSKLLDIHLEYIDLYTKCDYTIYGVNIRLLPEQELKLTSHPRMKTITVPETDMKGSEEHSYYLEALLAAAVQDGATHFVTLHVDSFPVKLNWAESIASRLSADCVLCTTTKHGIPIKPTSCLFFTREFYLQYKPRFLMSQAEIDSENGKRFLQAYPIATWDSGYGFLYQAFCANLCWISLERMNKVSGCALYDDMIFHLENAHSLGAVQKKNMGKLALGVHSLLHFTKYLLVPLIPHKILYNRHGVIRRVLLALNRRFVIDTQYAEERNLLFQNPGVLIKELSGSLTNRVDRPK